MDWQGCPWMAVVLNNRSWGSDQSRVFMDNDQTVCLSIHIVIHNFHEFSSTSSLCYRNVWQCFCQCILPKPIDTVYWRTLTAIVDGCRPLRCRQRTCTYVPNNSPRHPQYVFRRVSTRYYCLHTVLYIVEGVQVTFEMAFNRSFEQYVAPGMTIDEQLPQYNVAGTFNWLHDLPSTVSGNVYRSRVWPV